VAQNLNSKNYKIVYKKQDTKYFMKFHIFSLSIIPQKLFWGWDRFDGHVVNLNLKMMNHWGCKIISSKVYLLMIKNLHIALITNY